MTNHFLTEQADRFAVFRGSLYSVGIFLMLLDSFPQTQREQLQ